MTPVSSVSPPVISGTQASAPKRQRLVTDAPTRMAHALFALSFFGAYLTAESERWRALHVSLGYTLAGLIVFRIVYGLIGPKHARLAPRWRQLRLAPTWLRETLPSLTQPSAAGAKWRQGQNLLMAGVMLSLLALTLPLTLSGYGTYEEWWGGDMLEELHEFFGNAMLALVALHLALIAFASLVRRKNQALPMLSGRVEGPGPDLVKHERRWLAALLLVAMLGFLAWQWQQTPEGLIPIKGATMAVEERPHRR